VVQSGTVSEIFENMLKGAKIMECLSCLSLQGIQRISPGPIIYEGRSWVVEHAYPTSLKGWLVIVLKRHVEALHDLTREEFQELADIQYRLAQVMRFRASIEKEYMMCFAEAEYFHHIHVHFVAKPGDLPQEAKGPRIFSNLNVDQQTAIPPNEIKALCEELKEALIQQL
jgi:diadenosine tetraphosphate (Ap4A) HIT family hydrolase